MAKIDSALGSQAVGSAPQMKTYEVSDAAFDEDLHSIFNEKFDPAKFQKVSSVAGIPRSFESKVIIDTSAEDAEKEMRKNRLDALLGIKVSTKKVEMDGIPIVFRTLYQHEVRTLNVIQAKIAKAQGLEDALSRLLAYAEGSFEYKLTVLAMALVSLDDQPFSSIVGAEDLHSKVAYLTQVSQVFVESLEYHYNIFIGELKLKYGFPMTDRVIKEVAEDIKKA